MSLSLRTRGELHVRRRDRGQRHQVLSRPERQTDSASPASAATTTSGLRFAFKKNGIDPDKDVTFLQLGGERNRLTALERGAISATIMFPAGFVRRGGARLRASGRSQYHGHALSGAVDRPRKRDLKERRDLIRRYLRAYVESVRVMKANRELTLRVIEKYIHVGSKAEAVKTYDYFAKSISDTLRTERDGITEFLATLEPKLRACRSAIPTSSSTEKRRSKRC